MLFRPIVPLQHLVDDGEEGEAEEGGKDQLEGERRLREAGVLEAGEQRGAVEVAQRGEAEEGDKRDEHDADEGVASLAPALFGLDALHGLVGKVAGQLGVLPLGPLPEGQAKGIIVFSFHIRE